MPDENGLPKVFFLCQRFYDELDSRAETLDNGRRMYQGFQSKLALDELKISAPYYSQIKQLLPEMKCIAQHRRGARSTMSVVELLHRPTREDFLKLDFDTRAEPKSDNLRMNLEIIQTRLRDMQNQMGGVNVGVALAEIAEALQDLNTRVSRLETTRKEDK